MVIVFVIDRRKVLQHYIGLTQCTRVKCELVEWGGEVVGKGADSWEAN